jgi:DNA polymerase-1
MATTDKKLAVIDGNAVIYRAFYAIQQQLSSNNQPTNAVYGFFSILFKVINELSPDYLVVALDRPEPTFRHKLSVDYKAQRIKQPDELYSQIPIIKELLTAIGVPILEVVGYEADDIIGTVVNQVPDNVFSYIITGDKDSFQLVNDRVNVYWLKQGLQKTVILDRDGVIESIGLEPKQVVDYKSLRGDPSDNIAGVPGIGDKTATELLKTFGSLDRLQAALAAGENVNIKPRWRQLIIDNQASLDLSQQLAEINCQVPVNFSLAEAHFEIANLVTARQAFLNWQLHSLIGRLEKLSEPIKTEQGQSESKLAQPEFVKINNSDLSKKIADNWNQPVLGLAPLFVDERLVAIMIAGSELVYQLEIGGQAQDSLFGQNKISDSEVIQQWKSVLENDTIKKIVFQAKEVIKFLLAENINCRGLIGDPLLANYLLHPGERQSNLSAIGHQAGLILPMVENELDNFVGAASKIINIHNNLVKQLTSEQLLTIYNNVELPLITVLAKMERAGIKLDNDWLVVLAKDWQSRLTRLTANIYQQAGREFNLNSPKQLQEILFSHLGLSAKGLSKTKSGPSTDATNLQKLAQIHPIATLLLEYREIAKLLSTYALALPRLVNPRDGRLRASFHQAITATGRLSSSNPNLQNIPIRTEIGKKLRQAFVAESNYQLISFDYSQIELRIMASLAKEEEMIADFLAGRDIHLATAAKINEIDLDQVNDQQRRAAKAVNFGILYGQGPYGLAEVTGLSYGAAKDFIDQYFAVYPRVNQYIAELIELAAANGFAETMWGRRRYLPDLFSFNPSIKRAAERMAVNLPIQGTAADIMKAAMIKVDDWLSSRFLPNQARLVLQIHDEILIEAEQGLVAEIIKEVPGLMAGVINLAVPLAVNSTVGVNWSEL